MAVRMLAHGSSSSSESLSQTWNVQIMFPTVWCTCSTAELACGLRVTVVLTLTPQSCFSILLASALNSLPRSKMTSEGHGQCDNHACSGTLVMLSVAFVDVSLISNQPVVGSIIVKAQSVNGSFFLFLQLILHGPIRSTHEASQGAISASLGGMCPCFFWDHFVTWHR